MLTENIWTQEGLERSPLQTLTSSERLARTPEPTRHSLSRFASTSTTHQPVILRAGGRPIFRSTHQFFRACIECTQTQSPLTVALAIIVHKSQGITSDRSVVDISSGEVQPGLNYGPVSRVRNLTGLMFDRPFDLETVRSRDRNYGCEGKRCTESVGRACAAPRGFSGFKACQYY